MSLNNFIPELWEKEFTPKQHFKKLTINIKDNDGGEFGFDALTEIKGGMQIIDAIKDALDSKPACKVGVTNGQSREMKYCVCDIPKGWEGDNYCQECGGYISELRSKVFEALGEASMSWSEIPSGTFDSTNCLRIANELWKSIVEERLK